MKKISVELNEEEYSRFEKIATRQRRTPDNMLLYWVDQLLRQDEAYEQEEQATTQVSVDGVRDERIE